MRKGFVKLLIMCFIFLVIVPLSVNAKSDDKKVEQVNPELIERTNQYNIEIDALKNQYIKDQKCVFLMFYDLYDLYDEALANEKNKDNIKALYKHSDDFLTNSTMLNYLSSYDSNTREHHYATVSKKAIPNFQKLQSNVSLLETYSKKVASNVEKDFNAVKQDKTTYTKTDFKAIKPVRKRAVKSYKNAKKLNAELIKVAEANNIKQLNSSQFLSYSPEYSDFPRLSRIEDIIIRENKGKSTAYQVDYYETVYRLREEVVPVLTSLLLTSDEKKELELKKKAIYSENKNLAQQEKNATTSEILEEEEAYILKALESSDIQQRLEKFSDAQKEQYKYVNHRLNRVFEEDIKMLYNSFNDLNDTLKGNNSRPNLTKQERTYIKVIEKRSVGSIQIIEKNLKELNDINNMEKNVQKETNMKTKNKKAKKAELNIEEDEEDEE